MDSSRNDVVAALAAIDVIIGVDRVTEEATGQGSDHLVGIHVRAGTRTGLVDIHRKMLDEVASQQLLDRLDDGIALRGGQLLQLDVGLGQPCTGRCDKRQ